MPSSRLIIDCQALVARYHELNKTIMPMVKGNGYGLGIYELASFYDKLGVPFVGVSHAEEGIFLREKGYTSPIFTLTCPDPKIAYEYNLTLALNSLQEAQKLHRFGKKVDVHLQLDLGLNRFGFSKEAAYAALPFIHKSPYLNLEGVMCHLGCKDNEVEEFAHFARAVSPKWVHMATTKSLHLDLDCCNMVRLGLQLITGLTLKSSVVALHSCKKGEPMGYGGQTAPHDCQLAVLSIGYHDGIMPHYPRQAYIKGVRVSSLANVYMDFMVLDVTGLDVEVGDEAELFGPNISLRDAVGPQHNVRQLLCCLGPRVKREYVNVQQSLGTRETHCTL